LSTPVTTVFSDRWAWASTPPRLSAEGYYWVVPSERGRGVASQGLGLVTDWGFSKGIERLFLLIHPENRASNRLVAKMGFVREGILRAYEPVKDQRPDLVSWSLLPNDQRLWHH
jgi:RimJ/RimL family protein N-acetyltransferase